MTLNVNKCVCIDICVIYDTISLMRSLAIVVGDCFAVAGDVLIVENEATGAGYRIKAKAFQDTYQIC